MNDHSSEKDHRLNLLFEEFSAENPLRNYTSEIKVFLTTIERRFGHPNSVSDKDLAFHQLKRFLKTMCAPNYPELYGADGLRLFPHTDTYTREVDTFFRRLNLWGTK